MNQTLDNATISPGEVVPVTNAPGGGTLTLVGAINNEGEIVLNGSYTDSQGNPQDAGADLIIGETANSTVALTGGGTILMDDVAGNAIQSPSSGGIDGNYPETLDNVNNTIEGSGVLGNVLPGGMLQIENAGTIDATGTAYQLVILNTIANSGLIEDTGSAGLNVQGNIDQSGGGTLAANGTGSVAYLVNTTITGGTLSTSGGGVIEVNPGYNDSVTFDGSSPITVTSGSAVNVAAGTTLFATGTLDNQGTITLAGTSGSSATLTLDGTTTLTGAGTLLLDNGSINTYANATLDNASTIEGSGSLSTAALVNEQGGTIESSGGQLVDSTATTNDGLIEASAGSSVNIVQSVDQSGGGTIAANGAGSVVFVSNNRITGGTLSTSGGGLIETNPGYNQAVTLDGSGTLPITVTSGSALDVDAGTTLFATGTFDNQGTITLVDANGSNSTLDAEGTTTLTGGGAVVLNDGNLGTYGGATLDNAGDTIEGTGVIHNDDFGPAFTVTNGPGGTIEASGGQLVVQNAVTNDGLMGASAGSSLVIQAANIDQSGGGTLAANGANSAVVLESDTVTGGTVSSTGGGMIDVGGVTFNGNLAVTSTTDLVVGGVDSLLVTQSAALGGTLDVDGSVTLDGSTLTSQSINALTGAGTVTAEDAANPATPQPMTLTIGADGSSSTYSGQIDNQSSASLAVVKAGTGTLTLADDSNYAGGTTIDGGTLDLGSGTAAGGGPITFNSASGSAATLALEMGAQPTGGTFVDTLNAFGNGDELDLRDLTYSDAPGDGAVFNSLNDQLVVTEDGTTETFNLTNPGAAGYFAHDDKNGGTLITDSLVCFAMGTRILTARGGIAVEALQVGDLAITASGPMRPIRWLGHRTIDCRRHPRLGEAQPVRIAAHAFGHNRPARDLLVSPGHSICVDVAGEILIPAAALVNGATIQRIEVDVVTYWHVELDRHDILLAENLPAESYLDMGNRGFFEESAVVDLAAGPDGEQPARTHADFCRPFHKQGELVEVVRKRLREQAIRMGWRLEDEPWGQAHLLVDGEPLEPQTRGLTARFVVPAGARDVWLVSQASVPLHIGESIDGRALGLPLRGLRVDEGWEEPRAIGIDDPLLCGGFHDVEAAEGELWRWTAGRARLPAALWSDCEGAFLLWLDLTRPPLPRWIAPAANTRRAERRGSTA